MPKEQNSKPICPQPDGTIDYSEFTLEKSLDLNMKTVAQIFQDDDTLITRQFANQNQSSIKCCIFFIDGMVNNEIINENIIRPILINPILCSTNKLLEMIETQVIVTNDVKKAQSFADIVEAILYGDTVLFVDGVSGALIINTKGWQLRAIQEPDTEKALRGPREGFTESLLINISLIRRKLRTSDLKFKFRTFGTRTNTQACICYLESLTDKKILKQLDRRLKKINIDGVLDTNYISEQIKDSPLCPYKTIGITEKPDIAAAKLLEGRVALLVDGSPVLLTMPYLFIENFQSGDDYYLNFYFASFGRLLKILAFFISISVPAIYVALTTFHREMIPTPLALNIARARQSVPLPTFIECLVMLLVFEFIRETGIRMPSNIGQALSVVGALVIGQAAVEAQFVSAPMVIIVAITAITGLTNPGIKGATILLRYLLLTVSAVLGFYGYFFGLIGILIHLLSIRSFSVEYTSQIATYRFQEMQDSLVRTPWWFMKIRPKFSQRNNVRNSGNGDSQVC
ncbi:spore germination protein [Hydrogenoanaerobacterium sp.]|uniref:spore germination protein n=1 Tax=Hydrogenoanaerobacterium sp. TaxID=2953763 RepID=UPI0028982E36|nr:spore germination protein [Hydrogenoanaerobacterium sp.]